VIWNVKKFLGTTEQTLKIKVSLVVVVVVMVVMVVMVVVAIMFECSLSWRRGCWYDVCVDKT